jgi:hypothetical protein
MYHLVLLEVFSKPGVIGCGISKSLLFHIRMLRGFVGNVVLHHQASATTKTFPWMLHGGPPGRQPYNS